MRAPLPDIAIAHPELSVAEDGFLRRLQAILTRTGGAMTRIERESQGVLLIDAGPHYGRARSLRMTVNGAYAYRIHPRGPGGPVSPGDMACAFMGRKAKPVPAPAPAPEGGEHAE